MLLHRIVIAIRVGIRVTFICRDTRHHEASLGGLTIVKLTRHTADTSIGKLVVANRKALVNLDVTNYVVAKEAFAHCAEGKQDHAQMDHIASIAALIALQQPPCCQRQRFVHATSARDQPAPVLHQCLEQGVANKCKGQNSHHIARAKADRGQYCADDCE